MHVVNSASPVVRPVPYTTLGQPASRPPSLDAPRRAPWGSRNHTDISESVGGAAQKLVQFARPNAFCKNSYAQRPHLTPGTGPGPGSPRAPRTTSRGAGQSGVPAARRRVRHGGRPGARRAGGARQVHTVRTPAAAWWRLGGQMGHVWGGQGAPQRSACWCRAGTRGVRVGPVPGAPGQPGAGWARDSGPPPGLPATRAIGHPAYRLRPSRTSATQARATWKSLSLVPATTVTGRASRRG